MDKDKEIQEIKNQITYLKGRLDSLQKIPVEKEGVIARKPFRLPKINSRKRSKEFIILPASILLVILILAGIVFFVRPTVEAKYEPLDVVAKNTSGLPMDIYLHQNRLFTISGWESKINYNNKLDRIAGNNVTGWFFEDSVVLTENKTWNNKFVSVSIDNDSNITQAKFDYTLFKKKPYFKMQLTANAENNSKLNQAHYGFVIKGYDIYLKNGIILENDNNITTLKGITNRTGSLHEINSTNYQIFHDTATNRSIIIYSEKPTIFLDSFYWNVYWVYVNGTSGQYPPLYVIILENFNLTFSDGKWQVQSKYYSGELEQYINKSVLAMS